VRLHVDDELPGQRARAGGGDAGLLRLGHAHIEEAAEDLVHGQEGGRHPGAAGQELPAVHAVLRAEILGELLDAGFHALLLGCLRERIELTVRDDLGGDR
jgi:hypothetical protein